MKAAYRFGVLSLTLLALAAPSAQAHKPIFPDGTGCDQTGALPVEDITVSQVAYTELTEAYPQLWLTFDADAGQELYLQIALPQIERYADLRPTVAVLGPGLPEVTGLPFAMPSGYGAYVFPTDDVIEPTPFHEPFTGTDDWILKELTQPLPNAGQYYIVAYLPSGQVGKIWVAFGTKEQFGLGDFLNFGDIVAQTRTFHEVSGPGGICPIAGLLSLSLCLSPLLLRWRLRHT
jgi:hypothetical protein